MCVLGGGGVGGRVLRLARRELSSSDTILTMRSPRASWGALLAIPPLAQSPSTGLWGAASGRATHETVSTHRFSPRGPPPPAPCPRVSRRGQMGRAANLQSRVRICDICDGSRAEGRLAHRGAGSRPSRHMLPPRQLRPGWKPPGGAAPAVPAALPASRVPPGLLLTCPRR